MWLASGPKSELLVKGGPGSLGVQDGAMLWLALRRASGDQEAVYAPLTSLGLDGCPHAAQSRMHSCGARLLGGLQVHGSGDPPTPPV